tara:strand:+ start:416 stop:619 length:204 start_codon:yes stop_codon:yes gene_type:complete
LDKSQYMGYTNTLEGFDSPNLAHPREFFSSKSVGNRAFFKSLPFPSNYDTIYKINKQMKGHYVTTTI